MPFLPDDIQSSWLNVVRRLQSAAEDGRGNYTIVSIHILVDKNGNPRLWTLPKGRMIEPRGSVDRFLTIFADTALEDDGE